MAWLTPQQTNTLRQASRNAGDPNDSDLPDPQDKRSRPTFVNGRPLTPGQNLTLKDGLKVTVLGPARGRNWFLAGWVDDETGGFSWGSFTAEQIA